MDQEKPIQRGNSSLELCQLVTAHMRANGVRRVVITRGELHLEVELDPAAQLFPGPEEPPAPPQEDDAQKMAKGLCVSPGCDLPGGHLGSAHCRKHLLVSMNGG